MFFMNIMLAVDFVITILGVYLIFAAINMRKTGKIHSILLTEAELKKCRNPEGFVNYVSPRLLFFGVLCGLAGIFGIVSELLLSAAWTDYVSVFVILAAVVIFNMQFKKAREDFVS
jgi:hypothetical protein